jgi:hypothetical protein
MDRAFWSSKSENASSTLTLRIRRRSLLSSNGPHTCGLNRRTCGKAGSREARYSHVPRKPCWALSRCTNLAGKHVIGQWELFCSRLSTSGHKRFSRAQFNPQPCHVLQPRRAILGPLVKRRVCNISFAVFCVCSIFNSFPFPCSGLLPFAVSWN